MKKCHLKWDAYVMKGLAALMLLTGVCALTSCKDDDGLTPGDPNYFTSSRGQFTATYTDANGEEVTLYLLPGSEPGTALITYDGNYPKHTLGASSTDVRVGTYTDDMEIPETVTADGVTYTITGVAEEAFFGCRKYQPNKDEPARWAGLTSIVLPETVTSIGEAAFEFCADMTTFPNIPSGVTVIPALCFSRCSSITTVVIPENVKTIGEMAFYECTKLKNLTISEGVETIGAMAFYDNSDKSFTTVNFPSTLTRIGDKAFGGKASNYRTHVKEFHFASATPPVLDGVLYEAADGVSPVIYVPAGSVEAYKVAAGWSGLTIEEEPAN